MDIELVIAAIMTLVGMALGVAGLWLLPQQIPLWYSAALPEQQLAPKICILLFPASMAVISTLHIVIMQRLRRIDPIFSRFFGGATILVLSMLLIACTHILILFL